MPTPSPEDVLPSNEPATREIRVEPTATVPVVGSSELDDLFAGEADEWPAHGPAKGLRVSWPTAALLAILLAAGGIWGGAALQRHQSSSTSAASSTAAAFRSLFAGRRGAGGTTGASSFFGRTGASNATAGTVTDIIGDTLYVTTSSGSLVTVKIEPTTTIDRDAKATLSALQPGDTVVVQGSKTSGGDVRATSVAATQEGLSAGGGLFGG